MALHASPAACTRGVGAAGHRGAGAVRLLGCTNLTCFAWFVAPHPVPYSAQALYEACPNWGWSDTDKQRELADPAARFICVFESAATAAPAAPPPAAAAAATAVPAAPRPAPAESDENVAREANGGAQPAGGKAAAAAGPAAAAVAASEERLAPVGVWHAWLASSAADLPRHLAAARPGPCALLLPARHKPPCVAGVHALPI